MSRWLEANREWLARASLNWRARVVEPLRVRVWFESEVAWDTFDGITLEGALQFAVVARETGRHPSDVFAGCDVAADIAIPIHDEHIAGRVVACASWAQPASEAFTTRRKQRKRLDGDYVGGTSKLTIAGGALKNTDIPYEALATPYVDFYVRGDRHLLADLLRDVQGLGRNWPRGMGTICAVEISDDADDRSLVYQRRPQRALPIDDEHSAARLYESGSYDVREATTRAPYWHQRSRALCAVPC